MENATKFGFNGGFMSRAIKFRGQTRRKGEKVKLDGTPVESNWVYGGIFFGEGDFSVIYSYEPIKKFPVYTDTVGQYTGIKDIRGREIFEGDILQRDIFGNKVIGEVAWIDIGGTGFYLKVREEARIGFYPIGRGRFDDDDGERCNDIILGNIYDNPELLGG